MKTIKELKNIILASANDNRAIFVRLVVGLIFLSEGIQKFLFPQLMGAGRFLDIGFNHPATWAYFTGTFEIICGSLVILGLFTRAAAIPLLIILINAFVRTKWPVMIHIGFWSMVHENNTDFALTLLLIYLLIYGSGGLSVDSKIMRAGKS
jgi:putative oxidoreductase